MTPGQRPRRAGYSAGSQRRDAEPPEDGRTEVVERRERVEEVPGRPDERRDDGQADPAVDPQEQRRDVARGRTADDALGDDPEPARRGRARGERSRIRLAAAQPARSVVGAAARTSRASTNDERQGHGHRRARDIDGKGQPTRIACVQLMPEDGRRGCEDDDPEHGERGPEPAAPSRAAPRPADLTMAERSRDVAAG